MKSATLSAGLVAALLCPTSVIAGEPKCPKTARGTNRVTCFLEVEHTDIVPEKDGHHKRGHKHKDIETSRTIKVYAWSFFWNYIIKDDCPKTTAYLTSVLPSLGNHHHGVKCKVEVRWTPDNHKGHHDDKDQYYDQYHNTPWNVSWDYAGDGQIDWFSMPAKMVWPLPASFHRPDDYTKSHELGVKYELANHDDMTTLDIHSGKGNDFSNSWGHGKHWYDEHKNNGHRNNKHHKRGHKEKEVEAPEARKDHARFTGHYNTKGLHSCWVFEKFHVFSREHFINGKGHGHGQGGIENLTSSVIPQHHHYRWSTCEPHLPVCLEEHCEGDSCDSKNDCEGDSCDSNKNDCEGDSCGRKQNDCHDGSCERNQHHDNNCHGESCDGRGHVATGCHDGSCDRNQQNAHHQGQGFHNNHHQNDNNCHGDSCGKQNAHHHKQDVHNNHHQNDSNCHGESCGKQNVNNNDCHDGSCDNQRGVNHNNNNCHDGSCDNQHGVNNKINCHDGSCEHKRENCSTKSCNDDGCHGDDCSDDGSDDESSDGSDDNCEDSCSEDDDDCDC